LRVREDGRDPGRQGDRPLPRHRRAAQVLRAAEGVRDPPARRHVRRRDRGAVMLIPLLIFILVAGGIIGAYAAATNLPSLLASRKLDRRLREVANPFGTDVEPGSTDSIIKRVEAGALPGVDKLVARTSAGLSLKLLIEQSGVRTTPGTIVLFSVVFAIVGA